MRLWPKNSKWSRVWLILLLLFGLAVIYWTDGFGLIPERWPASPTTGILVLEDSDRDFRNAPFEDGVILFRKNARPQRILTNLNTCQTVGGCRALSIAENGEFFVVCEFAAFKLSAFQLKTGERLWSLDGDFTSATVAPDGTTYALRSNKTIYGSNLLAISRSGKILKEAAVGGFDIVLDSERKVLWLSGKDIKKCDLDLNLVRQISLSGWCAVSLDLAPDGSIWAAERQHPDVRTSADRILKIGSDGSILKSVPLTWSPLCLRVDRTSGGVWVTTARGRQSLSGRILESVEKRTGKLPIGKKLREYLTEYNGEVSTCKYDQQGTLLCAVNDGGHTLEIDQKDGTVWIAGSKVYCYSRTGKKLGELSGVLDEQKWIALIPAKPADIAPPRGR